MVRVAGFSAMRRANFFSLSGFTMTTSTSTNYLESLYKELALALGDAVWAFARIEWATYEYLGALTSDALDEIVGDSGFRERTSMLHKLVERKTASPAAKKRAVAAIRKANSLAEERNIIVHNPWRIWLDVDAKDFMTQIQKHSKPAKNVDLNKLRTFTQLAQLAEVELRESLSAL